MTYTIDATGKKLGRVATQAAVLLMGKNDPQFLRNRFSNVAVEITNVSKLSIDERKYADKIYTRYSGYPGGLKKETAGRLVARKGHGEMMRRAIKNMLPSNRLRDRMLKNLTISA